MNESQTKAEQPREHSEAPAEGDETVVETEIRMHSQEAAEGPDDDAGA